MNANELESLKETNAELLLALRECRDVLDPFDDKLLAVRVDVLLAGVPQERSTGTLAASLHDIIKSAKASRNWFIADQGRHALHLLAALEADRTPAANAGNRRPIPLGVSNYLDDEGRHRNSYSRVCSSPLATRPVLYTDTVGGQQTMRDDLWTVTTAELNALHAGRAPATSAGEVAPDNRTEFEKFIRSLPFFAHPEGEELEFDSEDGGYIDAAVHAAWLAWNHDRTAAVGAGEQGGAA